MYPYKEQEGGIFMAQEEFDPLAYIENAFLDNRKDTAKGAADVAVKVPSIGEYIKGPETVEAARAAVYDPADSKTRFRKRQLSAPRPRRAKTQTTDGAIEPELQEIWSSVPRNIHFLSSFFDDAVTANYYRGEFKESRTELIKRLLDPELTLEEVSRLLGVCPATVRRYTNRGWLGHHRTNGGQRRFRLSGVVRFVEEHGRHPEA